MTRSATTMSRAELIQVAERTVEMSRAEARWFNLSEEEMRPAVERFLAEARTIDRVLLNSWWRESEQVGCLVGTLVRRELDREFVDDWAASAAIFGRITTGPLWLLGSRFERALREYQSLGDFPDELIQVQD